MKAVILADGHVGSRVALANPDKHPTGDKCGLVRGRFFDKWAKATDGPYKKPDVLALDGDMLDGIGPIRGGAEQWTCDLDEQIHHAVDLIAMWKPKAVVVLRGSNYHVGVRGTGINCEEMLSQKLHEKLGCVAEYPHQEHMPADRRERSGWHWYITLDKVTMHLGHKIGLSRVFHYRSTPIAREMLHMRLNDGLRHYYREAIAKLPDYPPREETMSEIATLRTRLVIRAHAHYYWECATSGSRGIDLPCWQALSPFMEQNNPLAMPPDIGFVGLHVEGERYASEAVLSQVEEMQRPPHTIFGADFFAAGRASHAGYKKNTRRK